MRWQTIMLNKAHLIGFFFFFFFIVQEGMHIACQAFAVYAAFYLFIARNLDENDLC